MAKSVEQINRDLAELERQAQSLLEELRTLYDNYLEELGKNAYQRLISVCYQLCTQAFPEAFVKLSMSERDRLQRSIKEESQSLQGQLALDPLLQMKDESSRLEAALLEEVQKMDQRSSAEMDNLARELSALNLTDAESLTDAENLTDSNNSTHSTHSTDPDSSENSLQELGSSSDWSDIALPSSEPPPSSEPSPSSETDENLPSPPGPDPSLPEIEGEGFPPDIENASSFAESSDAGSEESETPTEDRALERTLPVTLIHAGEGPLSPGMLASAIAAEADDDSDRPSSPRPLAQPQAEADPQTPAELRAWQERLERRISQKLRRSSQAITRLLEKSKVLNNQLPEGLFAAAPEQSGEESEPEQRSQRDLSRGDFSARDTYSGRSNVDLRSPASPHILNLTLESADGGKKRKRESRLQIVAIYLRLAELEFEAPLLMGWRNKIRNTLKTLQGLERQYAQKTRERSVAEAEAAWRSTWSNS